MYGIVDKKILTHILRVEMMDEEPVRMEPCRGIFKREISQSGAGTGEGPLKMAGAAVPGLIE